MSVLFAGMAALVLLAAPLDKARAQDAPTVTAITFESFPKSGDTYKRGEEIRLAVTFSEAVVVTGTPRARMRVEQQDRFLYADYNAALSEASRLGFIHTVQAEDSAPQGLGYMARGLLVLNGGTIKAADDMTDADLSYRYDALPWALTTGRGGMKVDGSQVDDSTSAAPTALGARIISTPAEGDTYKHGEKISIAVDFDGDVVVEGTPIIGYLDTGPGWDAQATYDSTLSTARQLVFSHTVRETDYTDDIGFSQLISLNGGTIRSSTDARDANLYRHRGRSFVSRTRGKINGLLGVSTPTVPTVSDVKIGLRAGYGPGPPKSRDTYARNERVIIGIKFTPHVRVTWPQPVLMLTVGNETREAQWAGGLSAYPGYVLFNYQVQATDRDMDGLSVAMNALTSLGGKIVHARSEATAADLSLGSFSVSNDARYKVDGSYVKPARVKEVRRNYSCRRHSVLEAGCDVRFDVEFDQAIEVTGTPQLALTIGEQTQQVDLSFVGSMNGVRKYLAFRHIIQTLDRATEGISIASDALSLNGGTIMVARSNVPANLQLPSRATRVRTRPVDGSRVSGPSVDGIYVAAYNQTKPGHDQYRLGDKIWVSAKFTRFVVVKGTPRMAVVIGEQTRQAEPCTPVKEGGVTVRSLGFCYTVQASDRDTDGISIAADALSLNGGSIVLAGGTTPANLVNSLGPPGGPLIVRTPYSNDSRYKVDGSTKTDSRSLRASGVAFSGSPASGDTYRLGEEIRVAVTFDHDVTVTGVPRLPLSMSVTRWAAYDPALSTSRRLVFTHTVEASDRATDGLSIPLHALSRLSIPGRNNDGKIRKTDASPIPLFIRSPAVDTDPTRKVDGSVNVVEHGNTPEHATLIELSRETSGPVTDTGTQDDFRPGVGDLTGNGDGALEWPGDVDYFRVDVTGTGRLTAETTGSTDTVGFLEGATGQSLVENDNDGQGDNFRVVREVQAGTYYVMVNGAKNRQVTGTYSLTVRFTPTGGGTTSGGGGPRLGGDTPPADGTPPASGTPPDEGERTDRPGGGTTSGGGTPRLGGNAPPAGGTPPASGTPPTRDARTDRRPREVGVALNSELTGVLEGLGDRASFRVDVPEAGTLTVETSGAPHTVGPFGAGEQPALGQRDAHHEDLSFWSVRPVRAGAYSVALVGTNTLATTGRYTLAVRFTAARDGGPLRATLLNLSPAQAWVHFYCRKAHPPDADTVDPCNVRLQCGQGGGTPVAWNVTVAPETLFSYWPDRTAADGTSDNLAAALTAAGKTAAEARLRTTCQVFSADPVEVRAYTQVAEDVVPVANKPAPVDAAAPTRVATLLNLSPAQAWVHFYCRKVQQSDGDAVAPCNVRLQCGQQAGTPVAWDMAVAPETLFSYWPGRTAADGTSDNLAAALVGAGKTKAAARRRTTCQVFSADPVEVRAYTRVAEDVVPVANPPAPVDVVAPTRVATLLNLSPAQAWVHFYCRKAHQSGADPVEACHVRLQCGQQEGAPVAWNVTVAPETILPYWPGRTAADGRPDNLAAALVRAGKTAADARRRTTCQVFSADPVDVRAYTQVAGDVMPVANQPASFDATAPTRVATLLNLSPAQAWVHFYCRNPHRPDADTAAPCNVRLQCEQQEGASSVAWDVPVEPETIFSYWPGRTASDGIPGNLAAALVAAGKTEAEARRRTTCQVFSADPVDVRGYAQLGETVIPVKN